MYFDNQGKSGASGCTPGYVLSRDKAAGTPCEGPTLGAAGTGFLERDVYSSLSSAVGWKLDASRRLTGTLYVANFPVVSGGVADNARTLGGPSGATVTIKFNGIVVGTASGEGVAAPNSAVAIPINIKLPTKLDGERVRSLEADVAITTGVGLTGVSYYGSTQSKLIVPRL